MAVLRWVFGVFIAALMAVGAAAVVHGATSYATDHGLAAQFAANEPAAQRVVATVTDVENGKSDTGVWTDGYPKMVFDTRDALIRTLHPGDEVEVVLWRGGVEGVGVDGKTFYSNGSVPLRPTGDVALACAGLFLLCLSGFPAVNLGLGLLRVGERKRQIVDGVITSIGAAGGLFALGAYMSHSLRGGGYTVAAAAALVLLGFIWYTVNRRRRRRAGFEDLIADQTPSSSGGV